MNAVHVFFHWPDGGVWSNVLASALWFIPGFILGRNQLKRLHAKLDKVHKHLGIK